jgi:hypothetical protein
LGDPYALAHFLNIHKSNLHSLQLWASKYGGLGLTPNPIWKLGQRRHTRRSPDETRCPGHLLNSIPD